MDDQNPIPGLSDPTPPKAKSKRTDDAASAELDIIEVARGQMDVCVVGTSPLIYHALSEKNKRLLLVPPGPKNAAERASTLKHEPWEEYRNSMYVATGKRATRLQLPAAMFKGAMGVAARDLPGASGAQVARLISLQGDRFDLYGVPQLSMMVVRQSGMTRAPDIRTRAIVPEWACRITVNYITPILRPKSVANLLGAAGITAGIGDYRIEKRGPYGGFRLCDPTDPEFVRLMKLGRVEQDAAIHNPVPYDDETERLLSWYTTEVKRRGFTRGAGRGFPTSQVRSEPNGKTTEVPDAAVIAGAAAASSTRRGGRRNSGARAARARDTGPSD
jgi:hypothetical protein